MRRSWVVVCVLAAACGGDDSSAESAAQRDGLVDGKGWRYIGYAPPVGRESQARTLQGAAIVGGRARVLWSAIVATQQDTFTDVLLGEFDGYFNEIPLAQLGISSPDRERGRIAMFTGAVARQAVWSTATTSQIVLAAGSTMTSPTSRDGDFIQAATFTDAGEFAYAYTVFSPPELGVAHLDASGGSFTRVTIPVVDLPRTGRLAFDAAGTAYLATTATVAADGSALLAVYSIAASSTTLATLSIDPGLVAEQALVFPRGGQIYVALASADEHLARLYHLEGGALVEIAVPDVLKARITQGDDGALYVGFLDDRAEMAATVQTVQGHDLVTVGSPGFARYPVEIPTVRAIGSDLYVTVENANPDQPGFDLVCHGPSCLAPVAPAPASAAQCVTHSGETAICTEWNHATKDQQNALLNECLPLNGQFARTRCDTTDIVGGCRSAEQGDIVVTDWYYGPPTGNDTVAVVKGLCPLMGKTFVGPGE